MDMHSKPFHQADIGLVTRYDEKFEPNPPQWWIDAVEEANRDQAIGTADRESNPAEFFRIANR